MNEFEELEKLINNTEINPKNPMLINYIDFKDLKIDKKYKYFVFTISTYKRCNCRKDVKITLNIEEKDNKSFKTITVKGLIGQYSSITHNKFIFKFTCSNKCTELTDAEILDDSIIEEAKKIKETVCVIN